MKKDVLIPLVLFFILVVGIRLLFALQTDQFSDDKSYFILRQVEHIKDTGLPLYEDELSYGGRSYVFNPVFYYILAAVSFIGGIAGLKIFLNLAAGTLIFLTYDIALLLTKNKKISLFTSLLSGFIPIYVFYTVNSLSIYALLIPLMFLAIRYYFMSDYKKMLVALIAMVLLSPATIVFVLGMYIYFMLLKLEKLNYDKHEYEVSIFILLLAVWINFIFYKKALLFHGISIIWQNIPTVLRDNFFMQFNILDALLAIGIIPFLSAIVTFFVYKNKKILFLLGLSLAFFVLVWFRLFMLDIGLIFLGSIFILLFASFLKWFILYLKKTKLSSLSNLFIGGLAVLISLTSIIPTIGYSITALSEAPSDEKIAELEWMKETLPKDSRILSTVQEGNLITYFADRQNFADTNFLMIDNANQRLWDLRRMYITSFETEALGLMTKYGIDYIYFSPYAKTVYDIDRLKYVHEDCFTTTFENRSMIYRVDCRYAT